MPGGWTRRRSPRRRRALPCIGGVHPDTGRTILAGIGLYGPWLKHGANDVPLPDDKDVLRADAETLVSVVFSAIAHALAHGEPVTIAGFGDAVVQAQQSPWQRAQRIAAWGRCRSPP